ncbi:MAG: YfcE family phosphodiesterase [Clostridia bacterium]|nr:YfcE family phosphodiesterase [Clostridia bacterium]
MKIGIITDVHSNVVALDKIIQRFNTEKCDVIICCGDIIGIGPYPEQTVQYMMSLPNLICVRGNHDHYQFRGIPDKITESEKLHHLWIKSLLSESSIIFLKALPQKAEITVEGHTLSVLHYAVDSENRYGFVKNPTKNDLDELFSEVDGEIICYGHDHKRLICQSDKKLYINVGSCGCPEDDKNIARGAILNINKEKINLECVDETYDVNEVVEEIKRLNYPAAGEILKYFYGVK